MKNILKPNRFKFFIRVVLPALLAVGLFITSFFIVFIPRFENAVMDRKREMTKELTNLAWSILDQWYKAELNGEVTKDEAQKIAKSQIESLRYGEELKDYLWITDYRPYMIMHPYRPDLNNKDLTNFKYSDDNSPFVEMVKTARADGGGFVKYMWQWKDDSTRVVQKLSYVKNFEPWEWVIGTGIYLEDVRLEISSLEKYIINISAGIIVIIMLLLSFITFQNIKTEKQRLQAEVDLHESREKFKSIVEASAEGLIMVLENKQIYFNKTICEMLGYTEDEINAKGISSLFVDLPELAQYNINSGEVAFDPNSKSEQTETSLRTKEGTIINVLLIASPISFLNNNGVVLSLRDISTRKKITEDAYQHKEKYYTLINHISSGVFRAAADKKGTLIEANKAMLELLNINSEKNINEFHLLDFFDNPYEAEQFFTEVTNAGSIQNRLVKFIRTDGNKIFVSISSVISEDPETHAHIIDGIITDFTEQKKTDKEKEELINELQNSITILNRPIDKFVKTVPSCNINASVAEAVSRMAKENTEAILLATESGSEIGIVTLSDLKNRVLTKEANLNSEVYNFMSSPLISINQSSSIYDALITLSEKNVHHLLVRSDNSKIMGMVNSGDLQKAFHLTYLFFIKKIQNAENVNELKSAHNQAMFIVRELIEENRNTVEITRMTTQIADAVIKRTIQLKINEIGQPPVSFSFITLGSEGREEQTLSTDQDNAIIFEDVTDERFESTQSYFLKLGENISMALDSIGYQYCKGDVMSKNPKWCQPISVWKNYFNDWMMNASPQDLLDIKIFFDFKHIYGNSELVKGLQEKVNHLTSASSAFFVYMAESILQSEVPEGAQKLKSAFDIKLLLLPIVDLARLYALKNQINAANTLNRIQSIQQKNIFSESGSINLLQIYNLLMQIRFKHQAIQISKNMNPNNLIDPRTLSDIDIMIIKKSVSIIEDFKNKVRLDFKGTLAR